MNWLRSHLSILRGNLKSIRKLFVAKIIIIIVLLGIIVVLLFFQPQLQYAIERNIYANQPTVFFPCSDFQSENELNDILLFTKSDEQIKLRDYLKSINGQMDIILVGNRCLSKYQFEVKFDGDDQRIEIEKILEDQKLDGVPVFLRNI